MMFQFYQKHTKSYILNNKNQKNSTFAEAF